MEPPAAFAAIAARVWFARGRGLPGQLIRESQIPVRERGVW